MRKLKNLRHLLLATAAVIYYRYPARKLVVIGITGTDGKTTTSSIIYHLLKKAGKKVSVITTVAAYIDNEKIDTGFHVTSPDPASLQKLLGKIADKSEYLVLEVTSHGLDQHRLFGANIKYAVLTNITHEHLDYHKNMINYSSAKLKLFKKAEVVILNKDDKSYKFITSRISKQTKVISYSLKNKPPEIKFSKQLSQDFNRSNTLAAALVAREIGLSWKQINRALKSFTLPEGRLEKVKNTKRLNIIIDFAHTPNSLKQVLNSLKKVTKGKLIAVFGSASERDDAKRSMMGSIATSIADISVFTAEDPRNEDINQILNQIASGVGDKNKNKYHKIPERGEAITFAINKLAKKGDTVAILGKGHEKSMSYFGDEYPWSDQEAANLALKGKTKKIPWRKNKK